MTVTLANITFDCHDAERVARFWSAALDRPLAEGAGFASLAPRIDGEQQWLFLGVPEGKSVKNRVHVDVTAPDRRAEIARLVELGAEEVGDKDEWGFSWTVMRDPEGNEFCLAQADQH